MQLETSGMGAESGSGSVSLNVIPKSGGNTFTGGLDGFFSNWVTMGFPDASLPAGPWVPERSVTKLSGVPDWKDINPRFGSRMTCSGTAGPPRSFPSAGIST